MSAIMEGVDQDNLRKLSCLKKNNLMTDIRKIIEHVMSDRP